MASTLLGSGVAPLVVTLLPRKLTVVLPNSHFSTFAVSPAC